jgi:hypothetical protein
MSQLLRNLFPPKAKHPELYRRVIRQEAEIGGRLFGPVMPGARREFFCLDDHTWIWHEEWRGDDGESHSVMTRYDVRDDGIGKAQESRKYSYVGSAEARRLYYAIDSYNKAIDAQMSVDKD